jgi:hypothetical protein
MCRTCKSEVTKMLEESRSLTHLVLAVAWSIIVLTVVGLFVFNIWLQLFSIAISWVIADFILSLFIRGGGGIVQLPHVSGNITVTKGRAYIAFLIAIFSVTLISSLTTGWLFQMTGLAVSSIVAIGLSLPPTQTNSMTILLCSSLVGVFVFLDLKARFYARRAM